MKERWPTAAIAELCEVRGGGTPSTSVERFWNGDLPWVSPKDMRAETICDSEDHISAEAVLESATNLIPKGSILVVVRSGILARIVPISIAGRELTINQDLKALCPSSRVASRFLYYMLQASMDHLLGLVTRSATVHRLSSQALTSLQIPLPPLPEQQRIVAILDETFAAIAIAKANTEKNIQNARAIFDSHLESVFAKGKALWDRARIDATCLAFTDGNWIETKDQSDKGIRLIQTGNVGVGEFKPRSERARYISQSTFDRLRCTEIFPGDCLISRLPDPVGRSCLIPETGERMITAVDCTIARFDPSRVHAPFFVFYAGTQEYLRSVDAATTGTTRNRISRSNLGAVSMPLPLLSEQERIAEDLSSLIADVGVLQTVTTRKLSALEALKKSLLHHAFSGQL